MNKAIIYFEANEQCLKRTGTECFASDTISYIEADFNLGENWSGFDSVRAVWSNGWETISTVLDSDGKTIVPTEVLARRAKVRINLVGSIANGNELTDRLTTFPIEALDITKKALVEGTETAPITPSQFEQFVANVKSDADRAEDARDEAESIKGEVEGLKSDVVQLKADTEAIKTETESLVDGFDSTVSEALEDISEAKTDALNGISSAKADALTDIGSAKTQAVGDVTAEGTRQVGLVSAEGQTQIEAVQNEGQTQVQNVTDEGTTQVGLVRTEGGTQIVNIEQRGADVLSRIPYFAPIITDTAEGSIASFSDGADDYPMKSVVAEINPIQSGSGDPSPTNVRPISGWSGVNVSHSGADQTNPTVYSIPFKDSEDNPITVYGGEIDVVSGVLTVDRGFTQYDNISTSGGTAVTGGWRCNFECPNDDILKRKWSTGGYAPDLSMFDKSKSLAEGGVSKGYSANDYTVIVPNATSKAEADSALNGLQICYYLATPLTYQLTSEQIETLLGVNNIWADTGDISVEYPADTKLYIDKKIGTTTTRTLTTMTAPNPTEPETDTEEGESR